MGTFAHHCTRAGFMLGTGAQTLGCPVFPAGPGNTEAQASADSHLRPFCYAGTTDYLKAILEAGNAFGLDLSSFKLGQVTGGTYLPAVHGFYAGRGLTVLQIYGPGDPVADGGVGEVLVTTFSPEQVAGVMGAHPGLGRARLMIGIVATRDTMALRVKNAVRDAALVESLDARLQGVTRLRGMVELLEPGALANDGKVIEDARPA